MKLTFSVEAEKEFDRLAQNDPTVFDLVVDDLQFLDRLGIEGVPLGTMFGQWIRLSGPTGRVSYWITPIDGDLWLIESFEVD